VRVTPRAGADAIDGVDADGELRVRVRAAPAGGAANEAVIRLLAADLDVPRSALSIHRGATGRHKLVAVADFDPDLVRRRWPGLGGT
jgi:hypothetical protein